jgi:hypothetical protein
VLDIFSGRMVCFPHLAPCLCNPAEFDGKAVKAYPT